MGDTRYDPKLDSLRRAKDRGALIRSMGDEALAETLAAASRSADPYLANILATELSNRISRKNAVLEMIPEGVLLFDPEGTVLYANPAAARLLEVPNVRVGSPVRELGDVGVIIAQAIHSGDLDRKRNIDLGRSDVAASLRMIVRDGDLVGHLALLAPSSPSSAVSPREREERERALELRYRTIFDRGLADLYEEGPPGARGRRDAESRPYSK